MKKLLAVLLAALMLASFAACGKEETPDPTDDTNAVVDSTDDSAATTEEVTETVENIALAKGEWANKTGAFALALVGAELFDDENGNKAIRLYLDFTNKETSYTTSFADERDYVTLMQNGEELQYTRAVYGEDAAEYGNDKRNIRPGVTIRLVEERALLAEEGRVTFTFTAPRVEGNVIEINLDLAALPGAPAEAWVAETIAAPAFNAGWPESGTCRDYFSGQGDHNVAIKNAEFVDGVRDTKLIRVYFDFTNNKDEAVDFFDACDLKVFQDGVQLVEGQSAELCDSDLAFGKDVEPGQTVSISNTYILISDSVVDVEIEDIWTDSGLAKQFTVQ